CLPAETARRDFIAAGFMTARRGGSCHRAQNADTERQYRKPGEYLASGHRLPPASGEAARVHLTTRSRPLRQRGGGEHGTWPGEVFRRASAGVKGLSAGSAASRSGTALPSSDRTVTALGCPACSSVAAAAPCSWPSMHANCGRCDATVSRSVARGLPCYSSALPTEPQPHRQDGR